MTGRKSVFGKPSQSSAVKAYQSAAQRQASSPSGVRGFLLRLLKGSQKQAKSQNFKTLLRRFKDQLMSLFVFRIRLIPLVIFFAILVMGVRFTTFVTHLGSTDLIKRAYAADADKNTPQIPLSHLDQLPEVQKKGALQALNDFDPFNMTADQYRVLRGIVDRSDDLNDRERSLSEKEQILNVLLKKMDVKIKELQTAKNELAALVTQIDEEEDANTKRLVKMIEGMKPAQAAAVLLDIEFPILLDIMERIKEKTAAPILASMNPKKAGYLMTELSKRRKVFKKGNPSKSIMASE